MQVVRYMEATRKTIFIHELFIQAVQHVTSYLSGN